MKKLTRSKTFWFAVLQALIGVIAAVQMEVPEIAGIATIKSLLDIILRLYTDKPVA